MPTVRLFVYGSLKRGFRHHSVLGGTTFVREATTAPGYRLVVHGEYPALARHQSSEECVSGELYDVDVEDLPRLDAFEEVPDLYRREHVLMDDGTSAQAYVISPHRAQQHTVVPGGVWREPD